MLLITPTGNWVQDGSREFLALLGDPRPDYDAAMFAVRNLGFIAVRQYDAMLEVILHPRNVGWRAVDAVVAMLGSSSATLYRITHLSDSWRHEMVLSTREVAVRITQLCPPPR